MKKTIKLNKLSPEIIVAILLVGIGIRLCVANIGYNPDVESYMIAAAIMNQGGNVYEETRRYNYGPIWFNIIHIINQISLHLFKDERVFRYLVTIFLTCVDLGIFWILWKVYGGSIAVLFFLNPISIIITGYHSQFDNFALLIGLCSVLVFGENTESKLNWRKLIGLGLLGLSLVTKHIFFLFPLWLAMKQKGMMRKFVVILFPIFIFLISFLPYWKTGQSGIIHNVFLYRSFDNAPFWRLFLPGFIFNIAPRRILFFGSLIALAFLFRKYKIIDSLLIYTASLVIFSSAIANQYLAIVIPFVSLYLNWAFIIYVFIGTYHLLTDIDGLHISILRYITPNYFTGHNNYYFLVFFLFIGFIWTFYKDVLVAKGKSLYKNYLKIKKRNDV